MGLRGPCYRGASAVPHEPESGGLGRRAVALPSAFLFPLLLIYALDICSRQPVACCHQNLSEDRTSLCGPQRKPEDRPQTVWECRRLRGVLLHTLVTVQTAFLPSFPWQKCHRAYCVLDSASATAPRSLWQQCLCAACVRAPPAHSRTLVPLASRCDVKVPRFSVVAQLPSLCFLSLSFVVFSQPVSGG